MPLPCHRRGLAMTDPASRSRAISVRCVRGPETAAAFHGHARTGSGAVSPPSEAGQALRISGVRSATSSLHRLILKILNITHPHTAGGAPVSIRDAAEPRVGGDDETATGWSGRAPRARGRLSDVTI